MSPYSLEFLLTSLHIYNNILTVVVDYYSSLTMSAWFLDSELSTCFCNLMAVKIEITVIY